MWISSREGNLVEELEMLKADLARQKDRADEAERRLSVYEKYDQKPGGCVRGEWCSLCAHAIRRPVPTERNGYFSFANPVYACGKGACKHFLAKDGDTNAQS